MDETMKVKMVTTLVQLAGTIIQSQIGNDNTDEERIVNKYYNDIEKAIKQKQKEQKPVDKEKLAQNIIDSTRGYATKPDEEHSYEKDLTTYKIAKGVACIQCSRDHLSTASSLLNEAYRMTRGDETINDEAKERIGDALDELNGMERKDLSASNVSKLAGREKEIAKEMAETSRNLRHKITEIRNIDDLEGVAADAKDVRTKFFKEIFDLASSDGTVDKICDKAGLSSDERKECIATIHSVLQEKRK